MANEMRDRLVESMAKRFKELYKDGDWNFNEMLVGVADHLIKNGVIVPPCKVGDKTFFLLEKINGDYDIVESKCVRITDNGYGKYYSMFIDCKEIGNTLECGICDFGEWVFLTKSEAEQKLKEMRGGNG